MIIYLPDISKSNLPMKLLGDKIVYKYSGDKHAQLIYECITYYVYAYQLRCPKQDVLRTLIKVFYMFATEAGIHPCMLCF